MGEFTQRIQLSGVKKSFGPKEVLSAVDLTVNTGEIVGLIGPSGAGKSTAIKVMLGMEKADAGQALVLGQVMPKRKLLGQIGYMAQTDALYENLTALENLRFFGKLKGLGNQQLAKEIEHLATVVELSGALKQRVASFSGGMKRRLSLALALLGQPDLLILDEPTVGIDPALRQKIWAELAKLKAAGTSILITTHVMSEAELTDRVALLFEGKIIATDTPDRLEARYQVVTIEEVFLKAEGEDKWEVL